MWVAVLAENFVQRFGAAVMVQEIRAFFEYCDEERFAVLFTGKYTG